MPNWGFAENGRIAARELTLPLYPSLSHEQVDAIADAVLNGVAGRRAQARIARLSRTVLITTSPFGERNPAALSLLEQNNISYAINTFGRRLREEEIASMIGPYEVVIAGTEPITERVLNRAPRLRLLAHTGIGLDNINLTAARARGIAVTYTPSAPSPAVAELTIGQMIALLRKTHTVIMVCGRVIGTGLSAVG